jgi:carboxymethylenebutenolidase
VRAAGGVPDEQAVGDIAGAMRYLRALPYVGDKVGVFGTCSGGRHAYLAGCRVESFDAVVDCWGGRVVMSEDQLSPVSPVAPIDYTAELPCPVLGLFGQDDRSPSPDQVDQQEEALKKYGKVYEFHRYPGAGHGFFYYHRPNYRQEQAVDGWERIWAFLEKYLGGPA